MNAETNRITTGLAGAHTMNAGSEFSDFFVRERLLSCIDVRDSLLALGMISPRVPDHSALRRSRLLKKKQNYTLS
jgi:hypothetical protein